MWTLFRCPTASTVLLPGETQRRDVYERNRFWHGGGPQFLARTEECQGWCLSSGWLFPRLSRLLVCLSIACEVLRWRLHGMWSHVCLWRARNEQLPLTQPSVARKRAGPIRDSKPSSSPSRKGPKCAISRPKRKRAHRSETMLRIPFLPLVLHLLCSSSSVFLLCLIVIFIVGWVEPCSNDGVPRRNATRSGGCSKRWTKRWKS